MPGASRRGHRLSARKRLASVRRCGALRVGCASGEVRSEGIRDRDDDLRASRPRPLRGEKNLEIFLIFLLPRIVDSRSLKELVDDQRRHGAAHDDERGQR